jgi:TolA-binding protein
VATGFSAAGERFIAFVKDNARTISLFVSIVLLLVAGFFGYRYYQTSRNRQASQALRRGVTLYSASLKAYRPDFTQAIAFLKNVIDGYPSSSAAAQANLYLGHIYYSLGDYSVALEHYRSAAAGFSPESPFVEVALFDIAYTLEAQKKYAQARDAYGRILALERGVLKDRAILGIGRSYEQEGNLAQAIKTFSSVLRRFPNSPWAEELRQRIDLLRSSGAKT